MLDSRVVVLCGQPLARRRFWWRRAWRGGVNGRFEWSPKPIGKENIQDGYEERRVNVLDSRIAHVCRFRHMYICTNRVRVRACVGISTRDAICATGRVYVVAWVETGRIKGTGSAWEVRQCDRGYARACTGVFPGEAWLVAIGERIAKVSGKGESTRAVSWGWKVSEKAAESVSR